MTVTTDQLELRADIEWLKNVAGMAEASIAEWDTAAWEQWSKAMHADPHGPNPSVPAWMQPLLTRWHVDFSAPFPSVAQLWPTGHDWFAETDAHPELTLTVDEAWDGPAPSLAQVRQAWQYADSQGATPLVNLTVVPAAPWGEAVVGQIEAFYVVTQTPALDISEGLARILDAPGAYRATPFPDVTQLMHHAGLSAPGAEACLHAWEWIY